MALECVKVEKAGGSVRDFLRKMGCISPWGTWYRLQKEELARTEGQITDGKGDEHMKQMRLTEEQRQHAIMIAISGGDPRAYLEECGSVSSDILWQAIRQKLRKKDPATYAKIPARVPRRKTDAELIRDAKEIVGEIETALYTGPLPAAEEEPEQAAEEAQEAEQAEDAPDPPAGPGQLRMLAAEGTIGVWCRTKEGLKLEVYRNGQRRLASEMSPAEGRIAAAELPEVLKVFGMEGEEC